MNIAVEHTGPTDSAKIISSQLSGASRKSRTPPRSENAGRSSLLHFVLELRRRRVCRAATLYAVSMWLICQVLEIVVPALGLPEWTLKVVIIFGLLGFPVTLILSWLLEITPNGVVIDDSVAPRPNATPRPSPPRPSPRRPIDQTLDCGLVLAALLIAGQLAIGVLTTDTAAAESYPQRIAVMPFRVASANDAGALSEGLVIALQHELASRTAMTVLAPRDPYSITDCLSLSGAVAVGQDLVRVTATLIDNKTQIVTWSQVFELPRSDTLRTSGELARDIVAALPGSYNVSEAPRDGHAT